MLAKFISKWPETTINDRKHSRIMTDFERSVQYAQKTNTFLCKFNVVYTKKLVYYTYKGVKKYHKQSNASKKSVKMAGNKTEFDKVMVILTNTTDWRY